MFLLFFLLQENGRGFFNCNYFISFKNKNKKKNEPETEEKLIKENNEEKKTKMDNLSFIIFFCKPTNQKSVGVS